MICQSCSQGKHGECEERGGCPEEDCSCECLIPITRPDHATDEKLMWADLRRKERREG